MKYAIFAAFEGFTVAQKLIEEGCEVTLGTYEKDIDLLLPEQLKSHKPEDPEDKEQRLRMYKGIFPRHSADDLVKFLLRVPENERSEWFVFFDSNQLFKWGEQLYDKGFMGNFPLLKDRELEVHRDKAKEFVLENYPEIKVKEYHEFKTTEEGVSFLSDTDKLFALKSNGDQGKTIVPTQEDGIESVIYALEENKDKYEQMGFCLEEVVDSPCELTPECWFVDGVPVFWALDIENKRIGAGNIGPMCGCAQNLIVETDARAQINRVAFPPSILKMVKERKGVFVADISLLFDKEGTPYFGEFCFNRPGWDATLSEFAMSNSVDSFFLNIAMGINPLSKEFGAAVRVSDMNESQDTAINRKETENIWIYDCRMQDGEWVSNGSKHDFAAVTGAGDTPEEAVEQAYQALDSLGFIDKFYRPKSDFLDDYPTSIGARYDWYMKHFAGARFIKKTKDKKAMITKIREAVYE